MTLAIEIRRPTPRAFTIVLSGEIDYDSAQDVRHNISLALAAGDVDVIDLDVAGVTAIDTAGVGTLVVARRICREYGIDMHMNNPSPLMTKQLAALGAARVLGVPPVITPTVLPAQPLRSAAATSPPTPAG